MEPIEYASSPTHRFGVVVRVCTNAEIVRLALDLDEDEQARAVMRTIEEAAEAAFGWGCTEDRPSFHDWNGGRLYWSRDCRRRGLCGLYVADFYTAPLHDEEPEWTPDPEAGAFDGMTRCARINALIDATTSTA